MGFQLRYSSFLTVVLAFASVMMFLSYSVILTDKSNAGNDDHSTMRAKYEVTLQSSGSEAEYDIVTLVHHSDMAPFIAYGLRSWIINLKDLSKRANIFIICNPQAYDAVQFHLQQEEASGHETDHNIIPIHEEVYPFSLKNVTNEFTWEKKPTWIYQQLLKLYSHQVLVKQHKIDPVNVPLIKEWFTIIDSDTIFVHPFSMFNVHNGKSYPLYNVASEDTGAFHNDAVLGQYLIDEVFTDMKLKKAFPTHNNTLFTAIAHMMTFHGPSLKAMLEKIDEIHQMPAWKRLCKLRKSVLSEWELYLAWVMNLQRETVHVRPIPYINWGMLEHTNLIALNNETLSDVIYLSKHDDYQVGNKCCVNSNWKRKSGLNNCACCEKSSCTRQDIDCNVLGGNVGCTVVEVSANGAHTMAFQAVSKYEKSRLNLNSKIVKKSKLSKRKRLKRRNKVNR